MFPAYHNDITTAEKCDQDYIGEFHQYIQQKEFTCIGAKAALAKQQVHCMVAGHLACPRDDTAILEFLYKFADTYRKSSELYHTAAILFPSSGNMDEMMFDELMWQRLQALSDLDAVKYDYDARVNANPASPDFSFSLKEEAYFVIGLHPQSNRKARAFKYPALVFNPHAQFEHLKQIAKYENMRGAIRKRDLAVSGSINPMLHDFGESSEVYQYSGRQYDQQWQCPLNIKHGTTQHNTSS